MKAKTIIFIIGILAITVAYLLPSEVKAVAEITDELPITPIEKTTEVVEVKNDDDEKSI